MNNKGFAVSGILYTILLIFLSLIAMLLFDLQNKKNLLDEMKSETSNWIDFHCPVANIAACNTQYTPTDSSWKVNTVQEALDDLYRTQKNNE